MAPLRLKRYKLQIESLKKILRNKMSTFIKVIPWVSKAKENKILSNQSRNALFYFC